MAAYPQVTYFNGMTESPDETAQGAWLDLVTKPGFGFLMASIRYLQYGEFEVQRLEENGPRDAAAITLFRPRPVRPGRAPPQRADGLFTVRLVSHRSIRNGLDDSRRERDGAYDSRM